jgi:hypothetical protein
MLSKSARKFNLVEEYDMYLLSKTIILEEERVRSIREILESRSITVIGASRDPEKPGAQLLKVLKRVGFQGRVAGVNPQGGEVFETPLYRSLKEVPSPVDGHVPRPQRQRLRGVQAPFFRAGQRGTI